ncbi:MAG: LacI family DNA-binding transcriptional regulator [Carbonactinosporaceae bacterium]
MVVPKTGRSDARAKGRRAAVRLADLAAELNVSTATVSRALNGSSVVRPEVVQRVRMLASQRGYVPNRLARSLAALSQPFVGFLVPDVHNLAYSIAAGECARLLRATGHQLILAISGDDPERELEALSGLAGAQVAGLIAAPSIGITDRSREILSTLPVVEFNRSGALAAPGVFCDDRSAFEEAADHLIALGHRDIAYLGTTDRVSNGRARLEGTRTALRRAGLSLAPRRTRLEAPTELDGYQAARGLLDGADPPSALLVGSSSLSIGAARAVRELDASVPGNLSLVVYGDRDWPALCHPGLTTIAVPYREMAEVVAGLMLGLITTQGGEPARSGTGPEHRLLPAELVVRASTAGNRRTVGA